MWVPCGRTDNTLAGILFGGMSGELGGRLEYPRGTPSAATLQPKFLELGFDDFGPDLVAFFLGVEGVGHDFFG